MSNKPQVRPWVKVAGIVAIVCAIVFGIKHFLGGDDSEKVGLSELFSSSGSGSSDADIVLGVNTYAGFMPFMYLNGGLEPNEESIIYKEFGIKLKIVIQDDFAAGRSAFQADQINVIYCTADSWPVEMSESSQMFKDGAKFFNISNWSRGADAIVVNKNIQTVKDLIGKVVACSKGTASHTLLLNTLETSGIGYDKINTSDDIDPNKVNLKYVESGVEAANVFRSGSCDAAVCFSPDDKDLCAKVKGAHVLMSTKEASSIICDGLVAKSSWLDKNSKLAEKFIAALLYANTKINSDPSAVKQAAKAFAKAFGTDEEFAIEGSKNIHYVTLADELNFFGLNTNYTGITGEELYSKMCRTYSGLKICDTPVSWRKASDSSIIEALSSDKSLVRGDQSAEKAPVFEKPSEDLETKAAISDKKVVIEFATGSDVLDNNAKSIIDREVVSLAKMFSGATMRVEGNTDGTGSDVVNKPLSKRRAQAVVNYLIKEYNFSPNRFIVVGNGSKKAREAGDNTDNQTYRTTDFMLVNNK